MIEIAGLMISGVALGSDLIAQYRDLAKWDEQDLLVDRDFLDLALEKGELEGRPGEFVWAREESVPSRELRGSHRVVIAYNDDKKVKYRVCQGRVGDRLILMKKVQS